MYLFTVKNRLVFASFPSCKELGDGAWREKCSHHLEAITWNDTLLLPSHLAFIQGDALHLGQLT